MILNYKIFVNFGCKQPSSISNVYCHGHCLRVYIEVTESELIKSLPHVGIWVDFKMHVQNLGASFP